MSASTKRYLCMIPFHWDSPCNLNHDSIKIRNLLNTSLAARCSFGSMSVVTASHIRPRRAVGQMPFLVEWFSPFADDSGDGRTYEDAKRRLHIVCFCT